MQILAVTRDIRKARKRRKILGTDASCNDPDVKWREQKTSECSDENWREIELCNRTKEQSEPFKAADQGDSYSQSLDLVP